MGEGRRPGSGSKEHLGQGGRGPRLKGGMLAAGLLLATGALAATTASSTAGASRAAGGIALSASKPMGRADAAAQGASAKAPVGQGPQRLTGGAIPLTALKGVGAPREGLQIAAATRSATGAASAGRLAGATQVALLDWPRTDTGGRAPISGEAMTALAVQQLLRAGIAEADFGLAIVPLKGAAQSPALPAGASLAPAAPIEHRTTGEADGLSADRVSDEPMLRVMHQAERPFNPASTMKLVTTHAALSMLGPGYRWTTRFLTTGPIRDGVLQGDLILQGGGDPHLVIEDLHALMADLRAQGLTTIRGDLVVDDARFAVGPADGEAFDGDASQAYNVRPWAALTNFKASKLVIDPKKRQLALEPPLADVQLRYDVKVLKGRCRAGGTRLGVQDGATAAGRPVVSVNGTQVRACGSQQFYAAMLDHQQFLHGIFKAAWKDMGGQFTGRTRIQPGAAARGRPLYAWQSTLDLG
ncbi:MAG: D-alanyl-D-alanine carboxypeptidase/D-alanyl-D-alanine-endopeptidase, partial [Lautropia mirabilis]